jgi:hypothetical protein
MVGALLAVYSISPAQTGDNLPFSLTYSNRSSVKLEQLIGDCDWEMQARLGKCIPTTNLTFTRYHIQGDGQCSSFENNGKLILMAGDAISQDPTNFDLHAGDPVGYSTTRDPEAALVLSFYTNADGSAVFVKPTTSTGIKIPMGGDDLPTSGIALPDGVYLFLHTGHTTNGDQTVYSLLAKFDETALPTNAFIAGRSVSSNAYNGKFVHGALHAMGTNVCTFGIGNYRSSFIYLSVTPASTFWAGTGTRYFAGYTNSEPVWDNYETNAAPIVLQQDESVGNVSVAYSTNLGLWLLTYDAGWNTSSETNGIYFTYATQPWGPWATPQLIFEKARDQALGVYIHDPHYALNTNCPPGDGLISPTLGSDPCHTPGAAFAPLIIERFITITNNVLRLYYTMGTYLPYTVLKMRSEFAINPRLFIRRFTTNVIELSWTTNWSTVLEETRSLSSPNWKTSSITTTINGGTFTANAVLTTAPRFFRLIASQGP